MLAFFFQAEDGIRDATVTGVQTCALPISNPPVDDGHYVTLGGYFTLDTRNDQLDPTAGWQLRAQLEHSWSADVSPQAGVPPAVRRTIPSDGSYAFSRVFFDFRRYTRVSPS